MDFPTITSPGATYSNTDANAASTNRISAASPCADCGVPTATKCTCAPATAAKSVVNDNRPLAIAEPNTSANPGSKNGARPADNRRDLHRIHINTHDRMTQISHRRSMHRTQITDADDGKSHWFVLLYAR